MGWNVSEEPAGLCEIGAIGNFGRVRGLLSQKCKIAFTEINMSDLAVHDASLKTEAAAKPNLDQKPHVSAVLVFLLLLVLGIGYAAYGIVKRGFPMVPGVADPPEVLELMKRVTIIPSHQMTLFGPRITIFTKDGRSYTKQATGREFIWDFTEEARRIRGVVPGIPIPAAQFEELIATCRDLDKQTQISKLVQLTLKRV